MRARAFRELARSFERDGAYLLAERAFARAQDIERLLDDVTARNRMTGRDDTKGK